MNTQDVGMDVCITKFSVPKLTQLLLGPPTLCVRKPDVPQGDVKKVDLEVHSEETRRVTVYRPSDECKSNQLVLLTRTLRRFVPSYATAKPQGIE